MDFLASIDFTTIRLYLSYACLLFGVFDVLVGMIGLIRLPDIYNRLHATTKIATTGAFFVLLSILIQDGFTAFGLKAIAIAIFLLMTAPVAGHAMGRAAYNINIPPCDQTLFDAYCGKRQGDYCDDYDFHEGSYVFLDIERREKDHIQSDHYKERLTGQFVDELSVLAHDVVEHTPDTFVESDDDDDEELITGSESIEKSAPFFEKFEEPEKDHNVHDQTNSETEDESENKSKDEMKEQEDEKKDE
ncbi:monovalent cation/H(+) antiporter subunit G [Methanimicrococcus blatticola]|uniref:Monovalent cation/proton antiporter MnhG/PhaG subunit n=1 Tax=Methanimicrococcus blatticola TaxID=91560 RepID=A0A484F4U6_9EURY|nr:monovalent cation/H(+) antiporter subunit G [Methanimicrococcus blatticola]MCC2508370.1 monovalent cation/H(+) antiporter subunit G [Methanimicrococcus blatticola]TDQ70177.1 monovalent cation/proton antiporter MnhG/PhaG subunit [Methanimicrococcus blatticola]